MARSPVAFAASTPEMVEASTALLLRGASASDACTAAFLCAAALSPGALLGGLELIVAGPGAGEHRYDGSLLQPGLGAPRPRGYRESDPIPDVARVAVSSAVAAITIAHAQDGLVSLNELAGPAAKLARAHGAAGRAALLRRVGQVGLGALRETAFLRGVLDIVGSSQGGHVTEDDLREVSAEAGVPVRSGSAITPPPAPPVDELPEVETRVAVACDARGVLAVLHLVFDARGVELPSQELTASRFAAPVRRGVTRVPVGARRTVPAPIGMLLAQSSPWAAIAFDGIEPVVWDALDRPRDEGITLEQRLREAQVARGGSRRVVALVRGDRGANAIRTIDVRAEV